jgi:hypothetical protein
MPKTRSLPLRVLTSKKRCPNEPDSASKIQRNQPKLYRPVWSSLPKPFTIFATNLTQLLQLGSLFFGKQTRQLSTRVLARLSQLLTKVARPRLIRFG